jgi:3-dehydroquinate synthase
MQNRVGEQFLISLYGPPGSGKSMVGRELAERLALPFFDADHEIQVRSGMTIPEIFARDGESGFRRCEQDVLRDLYAQFEGVIALGGGALLDPENRSLVEAAGPVVTLEAPLPVLVERLRPSSEMRPLLADDLATKLESLVQRRSDHYASFAIRIDGSQPVAHVVQQAQARLGVFHVSGMGKGYDVRIRMDGLDQLGHALSRRGMKGPVCVVSDDRVGPLYGDRLLASLSKNGFAGRLSMIPSGEVHKNMETVQSLWQEFLSAGLERTSTIIALGGGVVGDLAGFAASTYLRGVPWIALPTSLLAMVDASLGGKTGVDLPQGKNLVGAFYPPRLVLADPSVLETLPEAELRSGLAEVVKAGVIADPGLYALCAAGWEAVRAHLDEIVRRSMAVKVAIIEEDPYERGRRAALNLGHTIGHAVELVSGFRLRHGEAVSIGMVAEARLAEAKGIAKSGLAADLAGVLQGLGLPVEIPAELDREAILAAMQRDKKRISGSVRFALPAGIGDVRIGVELPVLPEDL